MYHGSGVIGTDNASQLGLVQKLFASPDNQEKYPSYVLAIQFPTRSSDYKRDTVRNVLYSTSRPCLHAVMKMIDNFKLNPSIDSTRIYAGGFSMGGSTVINSLAARPDLFAAGISITGIPQFDKMHALSKIHIWLIHGMDDTENPIHSDDQFYRETKRRIRFWKLEGINHNNVFTMQLLGEALPAWLFRHHSYQYLKE